MNRDDHRLLREWLRQEQEERTAPPLSDRLQEIIQGKPELEPIFRYLKAKEKAERIRRALADREKWHRSLSFRLISLLFGISGVSLIGFVWWGKPEAFTASLFFFGGCVAFYMAVQLLVTLRARRAHRAWEEARQEFRGILEELEHYTAAG